MVYFFGGKVKILYKIFNNLRVGVGGGEDVVIDAVIRLWILSLTRSFRVSYLFIDVILLSLTLGRKKNYI